MEKKKFYITTPIYYPSSNLHIGHAYTTVAADAMSRFKRLNGYDVYFLTGTDEHGQKIQRKAQDAGQEPIFFVDEQVAKIKYLWDRLYISYDDFIRTTEPRHEKVVQAIFQKIFDQGDIYKGHYEGWYCVQCEAFWTERQLLDGKNCPDCSRPTERVREESYFFKLSKYADRLLQHIEDNPEFIQPVSRRNEMVSFIKSGLEDLSVSRTTFDWGIPLPFDPKHVVYVWFDALTNYISALGYGSDQAKFSKYWPADVHLMAKEIVRFHSIIWPIILMAADIELPKQVFGHGWLILDSGKMSKSKGNVVDPLVLMDKYGVDAVRYYLLREIPFGSDGIYSEAAMVARINSDLANDFGNLLSRTVAMVERYFGSVVPEPTAPEALDNELKTLTADTVRDATLLIDKLEFSSALALIWKLIGRTNKYIDETLPWVLAKDEARKPRLGTVLYNLSEVLRIVTVLISPVMPQTPLKVWRQLGLTRQPEVQTWASIQAWGGLPVGSQVKRGDPVFPRVELPKEAPVEASVEAPVEVPVAAPTAAPAAVAEEGIITIDQFRKLDLRVAKVLAAEKVPKSEKLLRLSIEIGEEKRQIVSGIAQYYQPEELVGKKIVVLANLKPAKIFGLESRGMLLAASNKEDSLLALATIDKDLDSGYPLS